MAAFHTKRETAMAVAKCLIYTPEIWTLNNRFDFVILDMEKDNPIHSGPNIGESLETYFGAPKFLSSFKKLTVSKPEEQEAVSRIFSASLTPPQRMEYMYFLQKIFFAEPIAKAPARYTGKVYFD